MMFLRSLLFNIYFVIGQAFFVFAMFLSIPFPQPVIQWIVKRWAGSLHLAMHWIAGIKFEVRGKEHIPEGACVIAGKHQSAWDTFAFYLFLYDPNYVLKIELTRIPMWGSCSKKAGAIAVDREAGASALKMLVREVKDRMTKGRQVIIFPEGTRTAPGTRLPYHPGIAAVYGAIEQPVIPVAINSGLFWGRRTFLRYPGTITMEILPPMPKGLKRREFMAELEQRIETATDRLMVESGRPLPVDNGGEQSAA
ncbi:1-acyl-sn-glycerol-3-phosphate acyltransferase [Magnetospira sp. QH-2]|uniref:lysophospholipid acyltransferase family protein n=1 Tax=Magnetospira sp. (strain QH-2) TaxID=1288970 RepID=UPI0003E81503|nr:lysophospholipid acyltransferase family protein [Magnetospira sp. QH-2]CCQ74746.1 putative 1-acylglycerol-3-phosphate O-acyltransferase [Magnetospira sp. QH-2]